MKKQLKIAAIKLRRKGFSYNEILQEIPVAKSTLSLWLRSIGLSKQQKQRLTAKKIASALKGASKRREQRMSLTREIMKQAEDEIQTINKRDLQLIGAMLYWAEGAKEKDYNPGSSVIFSNSDPLMISLFIKWLSLCLAVPGERLTVDIYIHENNKWRIEEVKKYWSKMTGFPTIKFDRIYYKKHTIKTKRKNIGNNYYGLCRIRVRESANINRKIAGWIKGICRQCGVV